MSMTWLMICLFLVFFELITINLVSIWFAIGALLASLVAIFIDDVVIQSIVFVISSIIAFFLVKPFAKKFVNSNVERTNLDRVIGKIGIVTEDINKLEPGEVKVDGKRWTGTSDKKIPKGSKVEILAIDGVKLRVKKVEEEKD